MNVVATIFLVSSGTRRVRSKEQRLGLTWRWYHQCWWSPYRFYQYNDDTIRKWIHTYGGI